MSEQLIQTPGTFGENGNFLLERELGSGGMGGVYMGRDKMLDRPVAVKVMLKELGSDPEFVEKFKKEAQSAAKLIHPNIAQIYSYGICDGMPYIAMELAAGGSLYTIMNANRGKTDIARVIKICQQVAQALQCASDQGFVHGDVKPENILLDANGNAKLVDFGLAAMQKDTNEIWGTPYYISPEKVKKEPVDFRADMYSLGGTLYHALTGVAPFEGADTIEVVKKRFEGMPKKPSEIRPEITPAIDNLVMTMLALEKEKRYPSFEALVEAFRTVLTSGLTVKIPEPAAAPANQTAGGPRRITVRGRRTTITKRPGATGKIKNGNDEDDGDGAAAKGVANAALGAEEDEEEGGNIGAKVAGVVIGSILLIGGVIGGLAWYIHHDKTVRDELERAQISAGIEKANIAINETVDKAKKFADEFDAFAARAITECQTPTDKLKDVIPKEMSADLRPGPSRELLDAIASTNAAQQASADASTNAPASVGADAKGATAAKTVAAPRQVPRFRAPTEDEKDPASPEGEKYLEEKKAWEAEQLKKLREPQPQPQQPAESASEDGDASKEQNSEIIKIATDAVSAMHDLWERAYSCQASAIRIRQAVLKLVEKSEEAYELKAQTRANMDKLAELSRTLVDMLESIKGSQDVTNVRKGIGFIKSKGSKTVEQTIKSLRRMKFEQEQKEKERKRIQEEEDRKKRLAEERAAKVIEETTGAKAKFDAIVTQGCLRQFDWPHALRLLKAAKGEMTLPEGELAYDFEIRKVNNMKFMHDIFLKHMQNHVFKGKLNKYKVVSADRENINLVKPDGKTKHTIRWQKLVSDYPGNLNELINKYIFAAYKEEHSSKLYLNLSDWANAMTGAALTMQLVCPEVNGAIQRSEELMKEVIKRNAEFKQTAKTIFPDMNLDEVTE